ncbi:MAG: agmatinase [Hyphomicrobiaceae bacterium]
MERSFLPVSAFELPRFAGVPTFMRLPHIQPTDSSVRDVDIGLIGVPWDAGTTNRPGARHGPRHLRDASTMIRRFHPTSRLDPFASANCADLGDVSINPADLMDTLQRTTDFYNALCPNNIRPLTVGGDHLISLPILRALAKDRSLGMVHFDAHTDLYDSYFGGFKFTHGTPFRRAVEEGLLDAKRVVQIGIRGTAASWEDIDFANANGIRIIRIEDVFSRGVADVMQEARDIVGTQPVYVSFDIDVVDPSYAPGTGTPEIGGVTTFDAQLLCRGLTGLDIAGCDLVEVSPPFDPSGVTAWAGASILFELLCPIVEAVVAARN